MAKWQDFINAIRQSNEDRRKQATSGKPVPGNFATTAGNLVHDFGSQLATNVQANTAQPIARVRQVTKDVTQGVPGQIASGVGNFIQDTAQSTVRGVVGLGKSVAEAGDTRSSNLDEMLKMSEADRKKLADQGDDPNNTDSRAIFMSLARKKMNGDLSDEAIKNRMKMVVKDRTTGDQVTKQDNPIKQFLFGTEKGETVDTAQQRNASIKAGAEKHGITGAGASALAVAGTTGLSVLDAPTGGGGIVKAIGKDGLEQLAKAGSEDAVRQVLKTRFPSMAEDAVKAVSSRIAGTTDQKAITGILKEVGTRAGGILQKPKDVIAGAVDTAKQLVSDVPAPGNVVVDATHAAVPGAVKDAGKTALDQATPPPVHGMTTANGTPVHDSYGAASDELLKNMQTTSQAKKDLPSSNKLQQIDQQWHDKFSPINRMVNEIEQRTGKKLATEDNPYALHRLSQGMPDKVKQSFGDMESILSQAPDLNSVRLIGTARQIIARGERGLTSTVSPERARQIIEEQRTKLGAEGFDRAATVVDAVQAHNKELLDSLHTEGIISDQAHQAINEMGGDYFSKMNVLNKVMTNDQNRALFASSGSSNTTKQSIKKVLAAASGHEEGTKILDPLESLYRGTESTMNLINKNQTWKAYNRLAEKNPDLIVRVRDPESEIAKIGLKTDIKEMIPVRNNLGRLIRRGNLTVRRLESQIGQLEKKGLNLSLKKGGEHMDQTPFDVAGLGGRVPTSQAGQNVVTTPGEKKVLTALGEDIPTNPNKLGPRDTGSFIRNLIERGSRSDIDKLKKMVDRRDTKMHSLLDQIGEIKSQYDDTIAHIKDHRQEIDSLKDTPVPEGYALISGFDKGVQGKLAVPQEIADVFTGKTKAQQDIFTGLFAGVNKFVKSNFTANNPAFALVTNPIRDAKSFAYNAQDVSANPLSIGKALVGGLASRLKQDDMYKRFIASGGKSGFYSNDKSAEDMVKELQRNVHGTRVAGIQFNQVKTPVDMLRNAGRIAAAPFRALQGAASVLEDAPRVAQFKASVGAGKSDATAALNARNVTVDFNQSGAAGQVANAWIPFLNPRLQGTIKSVEAIKRNPARAAAVYATLTAAPILAAAANNARFPDVMKMIPDDTRQNNFVIVLGDGKDDNGNYNQVIKIPKSDVDKTLGNPLEQFARYWAHDDPESIAQTITDMVGSVLPIDVTKDGSFNASRAVGSVLPPLIKAPTEAVANKSFYNDAPLVSQTLSEMPANEQVRDSTTAAGKLTAPVLGGGSPIKADNTIRAFGANLVTQNPVKQIGGKLSGSSDTKMTSEFYNVLKKTTPQQKSASKKINEAIANGDVPEARRIAQDYNSYLDEQFSTFGERYSDSITPELDQIYEKQKINLSSRSIKERRRNQIAKQTAQ